MYFRNVLVFIKETIDLIRLLHQIHHRVVILVLPAHQVALVAKKPTNLPHQTVLNQIRNLNNQRLKQRVNSIEIKMIETILSDLI